MSFSYKYNTHHHELNTKINNPKHVELIKLKIPITTFEQFQIKELKKVKQNQIDRLF